MSNAPHTWTRLYVSTPLTSAPSLTLESEASRYLTQVMRVREGEYIRIFNGIDGEWKARIAPLPKSKKAGVSLYLEEQLRPQTAEPDLWLCAAPLKKYYFDFLIMKATELGVSVIQPILTSRTQIRDINIERCRGIAIEAAEQSERLTLPEIREPIDLNKLISSWPDRRLAVLCAEHGEAVPLVQALSGALAQARPSAAILTGPEGGFENEELDRLKTLKEVLAVRLGPRILRADTAALAALSCWQALCGDWQRRDGPHRSKEIPV